MFIFLTVFYKCNSTFIISTNGMFAFCLALARILRQPYHAGGFNIICENELGARVAAVMTVEARIEYVNRSCRAFDELMEISRSGIGHAFTQRIKPISYDIIIYSSIDYATSLHLNMSNN